MYQRRLAFSFVCVTVLGIALLSACKNEQPLERPRAQRAERPSRTYQETQKEPEFYRVGGDVSAPRAVYQVDAHYSYDEEAVTVGTITVRATVNADGSVGEVKLLGGPDNRFTRSEVEAVRQWVFDPAKRQGKAVPVQVMLSIDGVPLTSDEGF